MGARSNLDLDAASLPEGVGAGNPWDRIESGNLPTYAANLRAEGSPEDVVALLVSQAIQAEFKRREPALQPGSLIVGRARLGAGHDPRGGLVRATPGGPAAATA